MIAIADINTIWRRKPFEALAHSELVLGIMPQDIRFAWRSKTKTPSAGRSADFIECPITLLPGWASKWTRLTAWCLWRKVLKKAGDLGGNLTGFVVTSPHYLELVQKAEKRVPTFYYCSDDYSQYTNWGGEALLKREAQLVRTVRHSFFVSRSLADRAVQTYGVSPDRVSVSPNATEERFLKPVAEEQIDALFRQFPDLRRPLVGVVGGVNERLDFDLIAECAALPEVGSLVVVGPVDQKCGHAGVARLRLQSKCVFAGPQPHETLPVWMQALDVALIPYRDTPLNRACSPMRLFDHLAAGRPTVATTFCKQVNQFSSLVQTATENADVARIVATVCERGGSRDRLSELMATARVNTWNERARSLRETLSRFT